MGRGLAELESALEVTEVQRDWAYSSLADVTAERDALLAKFRRELEHTTRLVGIIDGLKAACPECERFRAAFAQLTGHAP